MVGEQPPAHIGEFAVAEPDYLYGVGPIVVRNVRAMAQVLYRGEPWWHVKAQVANGVPENHGGWIAREIYLRATAIPARGTLPER
ncbi:MAG TPA: hypothetical protein VF657_26550 [Actinoplanes sp.]